MPDYKKNDPKGWCGDPARGAALGRPTIKEVSADISLKLHLRKIVIDSGGYDSNGTYFGIGDPLYWVSGEHDGEEVDYMLRASNRKEAKDLVRKDYPRARFWN